MDAAGRCDRKGWHWANRPLCVPRLIIPFARARMMRASPNGLHSARHLSVTLLSLGQVRWLSPALFLLSCSPQRGNARVSCVRGEGASPENQDRGLTILSHTREGRTGPTGRACVRSATSVECVFAAWRLKCTLHTCRGVCVSNAACRRRGSCRDTFGT